MKKKRYNSNKGIIITVVVIAVIILFAFIFDSYQDHKFINKDQIAIIPIHGIITASSDDGFSFHCDQLYEQPSNSLQANKKDRRCISATSGRSLQGYIQRVQGRSAKMECDAPQGDSFHSLPGARCVV